MTPADELRELVNLNKKRLYELKKQQAVFGLHADPGISIEIQAIEAEIQALEIELQSIERGEPPPASSGDDEQPHHLASSPTSSTPSSLPPSMLESPFGMMPPNSPFYIERTADDLCWRYIARPYATVFIQAQRHVGKSSRKNNNAS